MERQCRTLFSQFGFLHVLVVALLLTATRRMLIGFLVLGRGFILSKFGSS